MEPLSIFGGELNRSAIARRLRQLAKNVRTDSGRDDDWTSLTATFDGSPQGDTTLTLACSPESCSEPDWGRQMAGMRDHFSRAPQTAVRQRAMLLIKTFRFTLGVVLRPDAASLDDARVRAVQAAAEATGAVLFTPSRLRDAHGRTLFDANGDHDRDAAWPSLWMPPPAGVPRTVPDEVDDDDRSDPPSGARVAARVLALAALTARALTESDRDDPDPAGTVEAIREWAREVGAEAEMEPAEREVLHAPMGTLERQAHLNAVWRLEGLGVLLWALGRVPLPPHDQICDAMALWDGAGLLESGAAREVLASAPRPREELEAMRAKLFALHWRLREYRLRPGPLDFVDQGIRMPWLDEAAVRALPLEQGDLAIGGIRIDRAPPDDIGTAASIAMERHLAINWLCDGPELYSDADTST